jgi:hypothetical protein
MAVTVTLSGYLYAVCRWGRRFHATVPVFDPGSMVRPGLPDWRLRWSRSFAPLSVLRPEIVPQPALALIALTSLVLALLAVVFGFPPWAVVTAALVPWMPVFLVEGVRVYRDHGLYYTVFGAIALLQIGHLGEHSTQVIQMFVFGGDLSRAHGVFGQLDFETVHFVWDTLVWIGLGILVLRFGATNKWLWIALVAASVHEVEHLYIYFIYLADPTFYEDGGFEGIMGTSGLIGSPLGRPYLHFAYNVAVIVPLLLAFWSQTVQCIAPTRLHKRRDCRAHDQHHGADTGELQRCR